MYSPSSPKKLKTREKAKNELGTLRGRPCGRFSYQLADPERVKELKEYARDFPIYRRDTLTATAVYLAKSDSYYIPLAESEEVAISLPETTIQAA